jgi:spore coat polysaccharide biosynthesis protein SpsF
MGSSRLPGKVLMDLDGRPMLRFMLDRLAVFQALQLVVATSDQPADDPIEACAAAAGVAVVRGDEIDVLDRFRQAAEAHPADHIVRLTSDCPLIDPGLVAAAISDHHRSGADYTSNTLIRTFPDGLDVEVMTTAALLAAAAEATDPAEREHVTPFLYRRTGRFTTRAIRSAERLGHLRWTVDTMDDLDVVRAMVKDGTVGDGSWREVVGRLRERDRRPLRSGIQPAIAGEVPGPVASLHDPAHQALVALSDGEIIGRLVADIDDGAVSVRGEVESGRLDEVRDLFTTFVRSTPQIIGGDVGLADLVPIGAMT